MNIIDKQIPGSAGCSCELPRKRICFTDIYSKIAKNLEEIPSTSLVKEVQMTQHFADLVQSRGVKGIPLHPLVQFSGLLDPSEACAIWRSFT